VTESAGLPPEIVETLHAYGDRVTLRDWISAIGSLGEFVAYARLLCPDFIVYDDCVFDADRFTRKNYDAFMQQTNGAKTSVEAVMNHAHIIDLFSPRESQPSREMVLYVGRVLKQTWEAKLARDFSRSEFYC
jgi:hypothetical protein